MSDRLDVDVWSDVVCPWCAIGVTQFLAAVDSLAGDVDVTLRFMPFELNPDMGPEGHDQVDLLAKAYNKSADDVLKMRAHVEEAGDAAGFAMRWQGEGEAPPLMVWNSHDCHKLLRWALTVAEPVRQVALKLAFFRAYFQQRRNISDRAVLLEIAEAEGFDREAAASALDDPALSEAVRIEEQRAAHSQITSVPTMVVAGKYILQGASPAEQYRQALLQLASMEAMA